MKFIISESDLRPKSQKYVLNLVLRHRQICQYLRETFAKILALKIEPLPNFATIFNILVKMVFSKF